MKLNKTFQGVLGVIFVISMMLIITTIDSEWSIAYIVFLNVNVVLFVISGLLLAKYGRWS